MHWLRITDIKDVVIGFGNDHIIIELNTYEYISLTIKPICKKSVCDANIMVSSSSDEYKPSKDNIICNLKIYKTDGFNININNDIVVISIFDANVNRINLVKINFKENYIFYCSTKEKKYF